MNKENSMNELSLEELKQVSGGESFERDLGNGEFEIWIRCNSCDNYALFDHGSYSVECEVTGTFVCPVCGWTKNAGVLVRADGTVRHYG